MAVMEHSATNQQLVAVPLIGHFLRAFDHEVVKNYLRCVAQANLLMSPMARQRRVMEKATLSWHCLGKNDCQILREEIMNLTWSKVGVGK